MFTVLFIATKSRESVTSLTSVLLCSWIRMWVSGMWSPFIQKAEAFTETILSSHLYEQGDKEGQKVNREATAAECSLGVAVT